MLRIDMLDVSMQQWFLREYPFKFQFSDLTLLRYLIPLQERSESLRDNAQASEIQAPSAEELVAGSQGFLIRGLPIAGKLPRIFRQDGYLCYVPLQYQHCHIDLNQSFADYVKGFSSKTRSTIKRKIRKFTEFCGGDLVWKAFNSAEELDEFFEYARAVSSLTYQERLLDAGIPDDDSFREQAKALAADDRLRAYILFEREKPVSYLYCPIVDGVLMYAYLGYDPEYKKWSVGTILQWLAVEQLFAENAFRYFDFTEGESDHKRLFATHQRECANVLLLKSGLRNMLLVYAHALTNQLSEGIGSTLDKLGLKPSIRRYLRFRS